jgi:N-acyl-D-aspartate/D-glutamate deacylase
LGKTVIEDVRVFNGFNMSAPQRVVINQELISNPEDIEGATEIINGTGRFLIPGLIDNHCHVSNALDLLGHKILTSFGISTAINMACYKYTICAIYKGVLGLIDVLTTSIIAVGLSTLNGQVPLG